MQTVRQWLEQLGLPQYDKVFAENDVDLEALRLLTEGDLEKLGLSLGHRRKLLKALSELNGGRSPEPVTEALPNKFSNQAPSSTEAERRQLTVMFCDLVGSTELATTLDPELLRDLMQAYQRACRGVIEKYDGHVAQYLGDGLMVYFGWPRAHEDDAVRAIRAGLEVTEAVSMQASSTPLRARVGIHTGLVVVGETGKGDASIPKAAVGETPNIAARLQGLAEPGSVVVSERTGSLARGLFEYTALGSHALKGVSEPMRLFRVVGSRATESRFDAAHGGVALTPLVGREEEVALLLRRWQQARDGEGQVVSVSGEPGIGKSRLTQVLRKQIAGEPHAALRYQCSPYHLNSPLYPFIEQFEFAACFAREDTPEQKLDKMEAVLVGSAEHIAESAPPFAALLSLPTARYPALKLSPQEQKEKTLEALAGQMGTLSRRQPVLMVFEDAHWIDPTSQELLDVLVPQLQSLPILLVITYRTEYTPHWAEQAHVTTLGLSRLGRQQAAELVAGVTGGKVLPREVLDQVVAHTDGVPLFVEELTKSVLESGLLREAGDRYTLQAPLPALAIPTSLRDSLLARLDRLAPVKEIAQIGACLGREFSYELLARVSVLSNDQLEEAVRKLAEAGLVYRRGTPPDATYTFKHALVQDAAYDSLLKSKRQQLHQRIAFVLEEQFPDTKETQPELLAHHCTEAGLTEQAIAYWQRAGLRNNAHSAYREAITHLNRGLEALQSLPETPERIQRELDFYTMLGPAVCALKGYGVPEVIQVYDCAQALCQRLGDPPQVFPVLYGLARAYYNRADHRTAHDLSMRLLSIAQSQDAPDLLVAAHTMLGVVHHVFGELVTALTHLKQANALYDRRQHSSFVARFATDNGIIGRFFTGWVLWQVGYPDQALQVSTETLALAEEFAHPLTLAFAYCFVATLHQYRGEGDAVRRWAEVAIELSAKQGFTQWLGWGTLLQGWARTTLEQAEEGIAQMNQGLTTWRSAGAEGFVPYQLGRLAETYGSAGQLEEGLRTITVALEQVERTGERWWEAELYRLKGELTLQEGARGLGLQDNPPTSRVSIFQPPVSGAVVQEAEGYFLKAIEISRTQQAKSLELRAATSLARLWQQHGKQHEARNLVAEIYNWFTEGFDTHDLRAARELLDRSWSVPTR